MSATAAPDCPFCGRVKHGEYDEELSLPGSVAVFEPRDPVTPGHLLVVPFEHVRDAAEKPHVTARVMEHAARLANHFSSPAEPHPYQANIITSIGPDATQSVFHLHAHIVPRRSGDSLALPWTGQAIAREVGRYLCAVTQHGPGSVAATAWELADRLTTSRADRDLLTSILNNRPSGQVEVSERERKATERASQECNEGRPIRWIFIGRIGGYVCAVPDPGKPDGIRGMPVESEPCNRHGETSKGDSN